MAYKKRVKKAFKYGAKTGTTAKKRKSLNKGMAAGKRLTNAISKNVVKTGVKNIKKGVKRKNVKMVKKGAKAVGVGLGVRAQGAGLRGSMKAGVKAGGIYRMTAAHKKAISDALKGKKRR
jgi:hypothetical protein